ncbi:hypothetical protein CI109_103030 [Kwoniella shandongensis]|uniref:Uncharacterized protein n=1 Tax=Kwoniella shandongensis TaxID=1734106 RepID=A0A5M6C8A6_9TREE|nr:uncharacterized protein CI109_000218 [Kwoniella shandongensis]KAA5531377.1 hypothetical protein CI109_000218 [Kwoniella shandongensis]
MSTQELVPLFPSATHPALPISAQILSTLRHLTAPGKGNDLKSEERAALVGVAALLGCERIQSKDLPLSSAQKASSVSPAHFRSALTRCRKLLETTSALPRQSPSPSKRTKRVPQGGSTSPSVSPSKREDVVESTSTSTSISAAGSGSGGGGGASLAVDPTTPHGNIHEDVTPTPNPPPVSASPFTTPRKKYKYSSGIDISSLVRTTPRQAHDPVTASPLRQSMTRQASAKIPHPSTRKAGYTSVGELGEEEEEEEEEVEVGTPTKKIKYSNPTGIDLEHPPPHIHSPSTATASASARRRKNEDVSSFFALRPGGTETASSPMVGAHAHALAQVGEGWLHRLGQEDRGSVTRVRKVREKKGRKVKKRDWTFSETVWGGEPGEEVWDKVWGQLPEWLERNGRPSVETTRVETGSSLVDILLRAGTDKGLMAD